MKLLFCVLDGISPRHVDQSVMPVLASCAHAGGWCREGGIGVMPTSTYPNHATFVTGAMPSRHGLVANQIPTGDGPVASWERGPSVPTIFDSMRVGGRRCGAVFGDHHLVGATGARGVDFLWPDRDRPDGEHTGDVARDVLGYAKDRETTARVIEAIDADVDLVVAQLNEADTAAHIFGPDSPECLQRYGRSDSYLGTIIDTLRRQWGDWTVVVVSDHSQEPVTDPVPIDLRGEAAARRLGGLVADDGAVSAACGEMAQDPAWMTEVPGVEGTRRLGPDTVLAWCGAGRWFSTVELPVRGVHGSPRTAAQVAVVTGGHPAAHRLGEEIRRRRPKATRWARMMAESLGVTAPADLPPGAGGRSGS